MIIIKDKANITIDYNLSSISDKDNIIYFDIETTGFSRKYNHIYLIGCMYFKQDNPVYVQFFAENKNEEKDILDRFHDLLEGFSTIIHFNGASFDMPFVKERGEKYNISFDFDSLASIDIYKFAKPYSKMLNLENTKQKTFEAMMNIKRTDPFTGGELIDYYNEYIKSKDEKLLQALLLHNKEDVINMGIMTSLLSFKDISEGNYTINNFKIVTQKDINGNEFKELQIKIDLFNSLGFKSSIKNDMYYISVNDNLLYIAVPSHNLELKYFFPNYKDYYYLPKEDMAIHKSVSSFVDKNFRQKATPNNCYIKKKMDFIPIFHSLDSGFTEIFKKELKDKVSYVSIEKIDDINIINYTQNLLSFNLSSKS